MTNYKELSDQELIRLLKEDDCTAYAQIYDRYKFVLYTHAVNKLRDREGVRDIIQDVFAYLWFKRDVIEFTGNLSGYLFGAVRNAILNKVTHEKVQEKYFSSLKAFSELGNVVTDHRIREQQLKEQIDKEIAHLPAKMRTIFELSRKQYLSHREIAVELNLSEQTVSKQITNALKILKVKFGIFLSLFALFLY